MDYNAEEKGLILGIGHGTLRDGPGWRSIVYFKGCNLKCQWCGSPDTMSACREILIHNDRLKYPERAVASCERRALWVKDGALNVQRRVCVCCRSFSCAEKSIDGAVELAGTEMTVAQVVGEVMQFRRAHEDYGVTLSGGEATMQWAFYIELLKAFRANGLNTAVETNGVSPKFSESLPLLDHVMCDIKHMDGDTHKRLTGRSNRSILKNIRLTAAAKKSLWVRIPLVPGINDGDNIGKTIEFLLPMKESLSVEVLGYHRLGVYKWKALGLDYSLADVPAAPPELISEVEERFRNAGLTVIKT